MTTISCRTCRTERSGVKEKFNSSSDSYHVHHLDSLFPSVGRFSFSLFHQPLVGKGRGTRNGVGFETSIPRRERSKSLFVGIDRIGPIHPSKDDDDDDAGLVFPPCVPPGVHWRIVLVGDGRRNQPSTTGSFFCAGFVESVIISLRFAFNQYWSLGTGLTWADCAWLIRRW